LAERFVGWYLGVVDYVGVGHTPPCIVLSPERGGVELTSLEHFVGQKAAGLPVLVTQE